ncbi:MAG: tyrosine-type recombinase/integrase [Kiritimatiellia bacterium]|nr:tyrosine-type recombinase/integrase [Kiritimatiellia bacterium]
MKKRTGYLIRRGKIFYCCWTISGKKFMQTTGKRDRREAEQELNRIMQPFIAGDEVTTLQNIAAKIEGRKTELVRLKDERNPPLAVSAAWDAYERAGNRRDISAGTLRNYACYWTAFTRWLSEKFPDVKQMREVTFPICESYKEHLTGLNVTGRTFNAHRAFMRTFFNILADKARITENHWAHLARKDEHWQSRRPLTVEELRRICRTAEGELRIMLAFGLYLGCRMGDAACMDWGNVDLTRRLIRYTPRKTARKHPDPLLIPIHSELYAVLNEIPPDKRKGPVTPDMATRYMEKGQGPVSAIIQRHFEACGLTTTGERTGAGIRRYVSAGFHSLRHSAVSFLRQAGAAQSISQHIVGHSSPDIHALYTHTDEESLRRSVASLPAVIGDAGKPSAPATPRFVEVEPILAGLKDMKPKNWRVKRDELLAILAPVAV